MRKILAAHEAVREVPHSALPAPKPRAPRPSRLDEHRPRVATLLERFPDITAQRVFEELRSAGYTGSYTVVKTYVRKVRPRKPPTPSLEAPIYGPGQMAESDWSPYTLTFGARRVTLQVFAYVLAHSGRKSFVPYERADFHALLDGHLQSFERFGGVAHQCKYDNQKAVVLRWEGPQPIFNPRFLVFATYYEFRPRACRPRHPNDKPHVERAFWEFERSFLCGRAFRDEDDLRAQLAEWQDGISDPRTGKNRVSPLERFAEEAPRLLPLPRHPYDTARVVYRLASLDGFIEWDGNRYAVPYEHVTDILPVRITQRELFVYAADLRLVVRHELAPRSAGVVVRPSGVHLNPRHRPVDLDQLRQVFEGLGEDAHAFFAALVERMPRLAGYHARQILLLRDRFATADLCTALRHARSFGAYEHHAIQRILAARARPRTLDEYVVEETGRRLGDHDTQPRDLDEYDQLPVVSPRRKETS